MIPFQSAGLRQKEHLMVKNIVSYKKTVILYWVWCKNNCIEILTYNLSVWVLWVCWLFFLWRQHKPNSNIPITKVYHTLQQCAQTSQMHSFHYPYFDQLNTLHTQAPHTKFLFMLIMHLLLSLILIQTEQTGAGYGLFLTYLVSGQLEETCTVLLGF